MRPEFVPFHQRHRDRSQLRVRTFQFEMIVKRCSKLYQQLIQTHNAFTSKVGRKPRAEIERGELGIRALFHAHLAMLVTSE